MTPALKRYYRSPEWEYVREQTLQLAGYRCEVVENGVRCCNEAKQAHHTTYSHLGEEEPGVDTIAVCFHHHMKFHGIKRPQAANDNQPTMWDWFDGKAKKAA